MDEVLVVAPCAELGLKYAWSVVHRTSLQTGERQDYGVRRRRAAESLILGAACRLVAHEVRIGAAETRGACSLMAVDHDVVLGRLLQHMHVVVVHRL